MEAGDELDGHITADEMDENRKKQMAYEYLCHLEEAKKYVWSLVVMSCRKMQLLDSGIQVNK